MVVAIIGVLAGLLLPVLTQARLKAQAAGCMSNLRQLQTGWQMYAGDFNDVLLLNTAGEAVAQTTNFAEGSTWCSSAQEGWGLQDANTNSSYLNQSLLAPYLGFQTRAYRCPGDGIPSTNGFRQRSYSMNSQMGQYLTSRLGLGYGGNRNPGYNVYNVMNDLVCPSPSLAWIFCDEHPGSIDDGVLTVSMTGNEWPDVPGSFHDWGCGFSFGDGHIELHKWKAPEVQIPVLRGTTVHDVSSGRADADYVWFTQRSSCPIGIN